MSNYLFNLKYKVANQVSNYPALYKTISKGLTGRDCYTTKRTDMVIDGHPRSANTYATYAFKIAQRKDLVVANHIHKKSQFLTAEKYGIPAILLIREPLDCLTSLLIRQPKYDPKALFEGYDFLYNGLKNSNGFVVGEFNKVVNSYAEIIDGVNKKFGKDFDLYYKTDENEEKVKHIVQTQDELKGVSDYDQRVAYPNEKRKEIVNDVKKMLQQTRYKSEHEKCKRTFEYFMNKK
jgi:hypothetical protein